MNRSSTSMVALFILAGLACGIALTALVLPGGVLAQASSLAAATTGDQPDWEPTPNASGAILASDTPGTSSETAGLPVNYAPLSGPEPASQPANRSFTFQGLLRRSGQPLTATCDFQLSLWDALTAGAQLGSTQTVTQSVVNGQVTVLLNNTNQFGDAAFDGRALWIETGVRCPSGAGIYSLLSPRQALTAAPLASGLAPHSTINVGDSYSGYSALTVKAPAGTWSNPMGLESHADASNYIGTFTSTGIWGDSGTGKGVWGTTNTGYGVIGSAGSTGWAGYFEGNVKVTGKLDVARFKETLVINGVGPLPITSGSFATSGGTLVLFYSGSGYRAAGSGMIGMDILLDGSYVDTTGIYANYALMHLPFVAKQWVVSGIGAGSHTISLTAMAGTLSDSNDIYNVTVMELPY